MGMFVHHIVEFLRHLAKFLDNGAQFSMGKGLIGCASLVGGGAISLAEGHFVLAGAFSISWVWLSDTGRGLSIRWGCFYIT
ncbi:hypothetical protein DVB69_05525 [Sporosarcina sp. BI001-red]|nr:hypothetical protein DVB69_05525 [Sporosarcina sp. BI001-red]